MYVSRLRIDNIKGFHGDRSVDLDLTRPDGSHTGWTVVAGPNGSGKSTLLRAVALTLTGVAGGGLLDLSSWLHADAAVGGVKIVDEASGDVQWRLVRAARGVIERHVGGRGFCVGYGPFRGHGAGPRVPMTGGAAPVGSLFHDAPVLGESVDWLVAQHLRRLEQRCGAAELLDAVLALLGDGLLPEGHRVLRVDSDGLWIGQGGAEFPLRTLGDGCQAVAALVLDLVRQAQQAEPDAELVVNGEVPTVPVSGVVLIDEAEAHLHLGWQQRLGEWLVAHFPNVQFIVSTNSPYICQAADPGGLIRLAAPTEAEPPRVLDDDLHQRIVYGSGDDAALSELFGLPSAYSPQAEAERRLLIALERKLYAGKASRSEVAEYQELGAKLNSSLSARVDEFRARTGGER
ncbi:AAA family ATPase [Kitasatospora sp. MAP5-34]|uniref:AAA family ATPase n=1 Tax=Kitasatospora sp. MAP5-34 TaxID=3035102 RepID=UPI002473838F|nr:AAA family ATPase [Kitasatospora sp. MAP5-34]MDH6579107.1 energy-coupling factor transporter ATP-binding protein EcfA2 [Kitasatospora sp. MAP5-34]